MPPRQKVLSEFIENFLSSPAERQTDSQTDKYTKAKTQHPSRM